LLIQNYLPSSPFYFLLDDTHAGDTLSPCVVSQSKSCTIRGILNSRSLTKKLAEASQARRDHVLLAPRNRSLGFHRTPREVAINANSSGCLLTQLKLSPTSILFFYGCLLWQLFESASATSTSLKRRLSRNYLLSFSIFHPAYSLHCLRRDQSLLHKICSIAY
jgi:hypothetical protein